MAATFHLQVVSMDGLEYDGTVQRITLRSIDGDVAILARHMNYCTAIGMGTAKVILEDGSERSAACIGGMLSMMNDECRVISTTWEWKEDIDVERAQSAKARAEERLKDQQLDKEARVRAEAKLYRALVRLGTAGKQQ
ncbi:F-type H+-transporting ATPase subunit epsilon [Lachnospiraceae bacterium NK3A20]|jgi:F-type H+-transporting ATPase subunit epsilon|nr:F-type H+-transporting ATPase subunit epsilon [Lachnospiraceae bacterium NK3A20]